MIDDSFNNYKLGGENGLEALANALQAENVNVGTKMKESIF